MIDIDTLKTRRAEASAFADRIRASIAHNTGRKVEVPKLLEVVIACDRRTLARVVDIIAGLDAQIADAS